MSKSKVFKKVLPITLAVFMLLGAVCFGVPQNTVYAAVAPLVLDNFDGTPAYPGSNDLGKWQGANSFVNNAGVVTSGALTLQYNNNGWFGSDVKQDISAYKYIVFRIKGAAGGEQNAFKIKLGNAYKYFNEFTTTAITTAYQDIKIDMVANGVNRTSPGQLNMEFWFGKTGTISIDEIRFEDETTATDTQAPTAPANLAASNVATTSLTLSWTASTDNVGVTGYDVYRGTTLAGSSTTTSFNDSGLTANTTYSYTVKAKDSAGNISAASAVNSVTTLTATDTQAPTAPANLAASNVATTSLTLSWTASTDNVGVTGYDVYRGTTLAGSSTSTSFNDSGLTANTTYSYTVKAKDSAGNVSAASAAKSVTTLDNTTVTTYEAEAAGNTLAGGAVVASSASCSGGKKVGYIGNNSGTLQFNGVNAGAAGSYTMTVYYLAAVTRSISFSVNGGTATSVSFPSSGGWTIVGNQTVSINLNAGSNTIKLSNPTGWAPDVDKITINASAPVDTTVPSAPTNLATSNVTATNLTLSWTASTDNVGVTGYDIYRGTTLAGSSTTTSFNDSGLTANTTYSYTVKAKDAAGNVSAASSATSATTLTATDTQAPTAPTNLATSNVTATNLTLSWTASTDNVGVTGYDVYRGTTLAGSSTTTSFNDSGLTANTTYSYTVKAKDAAGNVSAASATKSVTTLASADTQAPTVPTSLAATYISNTTLILTWVASGDNVGVTGYDVYRGTTKVGSSTATNYNDSGLTANTTYSYTVKAKDAAGNVSAASNALSVTTSPIPPASETVPAGVPTNPFAITTPDASLTVHSLTKGTDPITNPLKGVAIFYGAGDGANKAVLRGGINNSIEWHYFGFGELMTGPDSYDWTHMEQVLNHAASHGKQLSLRVASTNSFSGKDSPTFLSAYKRSNGLLMYDEPAVKSAMLNFIRAFGAKYDGDSRIAFVQMGLVGFWGEWHTWPYNGLDGKADYMPSNATSIQIFDAFNSSFVKSPLEIRYPTVGGGTHLTSLSKIGYHDDSFLFKESDIYMNNQVRSMTLPMSMNGKTDGFMQLHLNAGAENKWITASIGGEVRPEIQNIAFGPETSNKDDAIKDIEVTHTSWLMGDNVAYNINNPVEVAAWRKMGYNFYVKNSYFNNTVTGDFKVGVQIENTGVAPFYYGPDTWPVEIGLKNSSGTIVKTVSTGWDLRTIMPQQIRVFPDWNVAGNPTYMNFGQPVYFDTTISSSELTAGNYKIVMQVKNPLWNIKQASWINPLPVLFANDTQGADGWLELGSVIIN